MRTTVLSANSESDVMCCLQSYQGLIIDLPFRVSSSGVYKVMFYLTIVIPQKYVTATFALHDSSQVLF